MNEEHFTARELADRLGVKTQTLAKWRVTGEGPPFMKLGGIRGVVRYKVADVEEWEADSRYKSTCEY